MIFLFLGDREDRDADRDSEAFVFGGSGKRGFLMEIGICAVFPPPWDRENRGEMEEGSGGKLDGERENDEGTMREFIRYPCSRFFFFIFFPFPISFSLEEWNGNRRFTHGNIAFLPRERYQEGKEVCPCVVPLSHFCFSRMGRQS